MLEPFGRQLALLGAVAITALALAAPPASATPDPLPLMSAPADPIGYYRGSQEAARLIEAKQWAEAEVLLRRLTQAYPYDTAPTISASNWGRLALALRQQKKYADAITAYRRAIELQGPGIQYAGPANARYWIAVCQAALGEKDSALATLRQMVFHDGYVQRPDLLEDANFASLRNDARFREIAGAKDVAGLDRTAGWRGDVDHLIAEMRRANPSGYAIPDEVFRRADDLKRDIPRLSDEAVVMGLSRVMEPLNRGHTALWLGAGDPRPGLSFPPMPLRLYQFPEGLYVTEAGAGAEGLTGARVLAFGGVAAEDVLRRFAAGQSDQSAMSILWTAPLQIVRPGVLEGLGASDSPDRAELTLRLTSGEVVKRTLATVPEAPRQDWSRRLNPPPGVSPPLFLGHWKENHWFEALPDRRAVYVQVNNILPDPDETLPQFAIRLRKALAESPQPNLIVDIRMNTGGNSFQYPELLRTLAAYSAVEGRKTYVITGRFVYSATANFVGDVDRIIKPVFVGEPTGAAGVNWGDESVFVLPYSRIMGAFPAVRWQLSHPWDQRGFISPQVPVQQTAKAYFSGEDPVLDTVFRLIEQGG